MKNTLLIANIVLYFQSCGVKVSKNKVERLGGESFQCSRHVILTDHFRNQILFQKRPLHQQYIKSWTLQNNIWNNKKKWGATLNDASQLQDWTPGEMIPALPGLNHSKDSNDNPDATSFSHFCRWVARLQIWRAQTEFRLKHGKLCCYSLELLKSSPNTQQSSSTLIGKSLHCGFHPLTTWFTRSFTLMAVWLSSQAHHLKDISVASRSKVTNIFTPRAMPGRLRPGSSLEGPWGTDHPGFLLNISD